MGYLIIKWFFVIEIKVGGHKQIWFRSFKNYSVDEYAKVLGKVTFPNYEKDDNTNKAYNDFFQKLIEVVENCENKKYKQWMIWQGNCRKIMHKRYTN